MIPAGKAGEQLRKELAQGSKQLVANEKKRQQETSKMLKTFKNSRLESNAKLKKNLSEGQARLKSEVNESLVDARTMINDFQSTRQKMAGELKDELQKSRDERNATVGEMRSSLPASPKRNQR